MKQLGGLLLIIILVLRLYWFLFFAVCYCDVVRLRGEQVKLSFISQCSSNENQPAATNTQASNTLKDTVNYPHLLILKHNQLAFIFFIENFRIYSLFKRPLDSCLHLRHKERHVVKKESSQKS